MENTELETTGQKRIDTVATDIKKLIADISNGKPAPITEENMNDFLNNVKEAMIAWNTPPVKEKYNGVLRMSILGKPARQLWYDKYSPKETKEYDASNNLKFLYGHIIEHLLLYLTELAGHKVEDRQMKVKVDDVKGHIDAKVDGEICDVKSASPFSFKKFKNGEIVNDDPFGYHAQLSGYETANGTNKGGFLVADKSSGDICFYKPEDLAKPDTKSLIKDLNTKLASDTPPERCYELKTEKNGNKVIPVGCQFCIHKFECYADANKGKGLRVFKYANKNVFLADVVKEPNVEDITKEFTDGIKTQTPAS
jgi:hypothetical protein